MIGSMIVIVSLAVLSLEDINARYEFIEYVEDARIVDCHELGELLVDPQPARYAGALQVEGLQNLSVGGATGGLLCHLSLSNRGGW